MTRTEEQPINKQSVIKKYKELVEQYLATIDDVEEYDFSNHKLSITTNHCNSTSFCS